MAHHRFTDECWTMSGILRLALLLGAGALAYSWFSATLPSGEKRYESFVREFVDRRFGSTRR